MSSKFSGIFVAVVTPFKRNGELDEQAMGNIADFLVRKKVHGLYACGTTGEGVSMTLEQRKRVAEICLEHSSGRVTVMTQIGDESIDSARELAQHAADIGVDGIAALTPYYYKPDEEALLDYYCEIGTFSDLPLFIYHIPPMTGLTLSPHLIEKIRNEVPAIKGIKDSSGDFKNLLEILYFKDREFSVFSGSDEYAYAGLISGMDGCVTGYASAFPENYVALYRAFSEGNKSRALSLQKKITMIKNQLRKPYIQPIKEALKMRGTDAGFVRKPLRPMSAEEIADLRKRLESVKAF